MSGRKIPSNKSKGRKNEFTKIRKDNWSSNPPQVTSYLAYSRLGSPPTNVDDDSPKLTYTSPNCGFGWRFRLGESFLYQKSNSNPRVQELVGQVDLIFQPNLCSSMPLSNFKVNVKVSYPTNSAKSAHEKAFSDVPIQSDYTIGTYSEPFGYKGQVHIEITLTFGASDGLSLPTTSSINTRKALHHSLDEPSFVDTKFYLFSAKVQGRPTNPKPVFAKSMLLTDSSSYLYDLLSPEAGFTTGSPCNLREDVTEEIAKLDADAYDYESDSDLEDEAGEQLGKGKGKELVSETEERSDCENKTEKISTVGHQDGRAFAINGTAHKTWKAFIFYTYTNDIQFNALRSQLKSVALTRSEFADLDLTGCSPKSMYRFADYANLPQLMSLAKKGIRNGLDKSNIMKELFSHFTSKYQDIIELEVDYLVANFTPMLARKLDEMLEMVVLGEMPHCFRVLAFTMRRLRGDNSQDAWNALSSGKPKPGPCPLPPAANFIPSDLSPASGPTPFGSWSTPPFTLPHDSMKAPPTPEVFGGLWGRG